MGSGRRRIAIAIALACGAGPLAAAPARKAAEGSSSEPVPDFLMGIEREGAAFLRLRGLDVGRLGLAIPSPSGGRRAQEEARVISARVEAGRAEIRLRLAGPESGAAIVVEERVRERTVANECHIAYLIRVEGEAPVAAVELSLLLRPDALGPYPLLLGSDAGEEELRIPAEGGAQDLGRWRVRSVRVPLRRENAFELELDRETWASIQDLRRLGPDGIELRFSLFPGAERVPPGSEALWKATLRAPAGLALAFEPERLQVRTDTRGWFPYPLRLDATPADLGFLADKPAGKHGFLTVRGDRFVFQDGTEARFWGVNLAGPACFPEPEEAEATARRLARSGVNLVRLHALDASGATPNIFRFRAEGRRGTRSLDPESLARLDRLIDALAREGIYVAFDLLVSRKFCAEDGVAGAEFLDAGARPYANFDPGLIALEREYAEALWTHRNELRGAACRDDPAIVFQAIARENDLLSQPVLLEPYRAALGKRYATWRRARGLDAGEASVDLRSPAPDLLGFLIDVQREHYVGMKGFLRSLGVRVPIAGSTTTRSLALEAALDVTDHRQAHAYRNRPRPGDGAVANEPMVRATSTIFSDLAFRRAAGVPFVVGEWDEPWPNDWRAELPLWMAAIAAFQGWSGAAAYAYRTKVGPPGDALEDPHEIAIDPCRFSLFPHAALIARRDVRPARVRCIVLFPREAARAVPNPAPWTTPALDLLPERHRAEIAIGDPPDGARILDPADPIVDPSERSVASDTGEIRRNWEEGWGAVDTPGTQAAFGFIGLRGPIDLADISIDARTPFAAIAVSSLAGEPIRRSPLLLLTAVARAENTGLAFDFLRRRKLADGTAPILLEPVRARIAIATEREDLAVLAIGPGGETLREVPAARADGRLRFEIGPDHRTIHYRIAAAGVGPPPRPRASAVGTAVPVPDTPATGTGSAGSLP